MTRVSDRHYYIARDWLAVTAVTALATSVACRALAGAWGARWPLQLAGATSLGLWHADRASKSNERMFALMERANTAELREICRDWPCEEVLKAARVAVDHYSRRLVVADELSQRADLTPESFTEIWTTFFPPWGMYEIPEGKSGTISNATCTRLLEERGEDWELLRSLFDFTRSDPNRQKQILKAFPLQANLGNYAERGQDSYGRKVKFYPRLAKETVESLLRDDPDLWILAICHKQGGAIEEQLSEVSVDTITALGDPKNFYKFWDHSLNKRAFGLWDQDRIQLFMKALFAANTFRFRDDVFEPALGSGKLDDKRLLFWAENGFASRVISHHPRLYCQLSQERQEQVARNISSEDLLVALETGGTIREMTNRWSQEGALLISLARAKEDTKIIEMLMDGIMAAIKRTRSFDPLQAIHIIITNRLINRFNQQLLELMDRTDLCRLLVNREIEEEAKKKIRSFIAEQGLPANLLPDLDALAEGYVWHLEQKLAPYFPQFLTWVRGGTATLYEHISWMLEYRSIPHPNAQNDAPIGFPGEKNQALWWLGGAAAMSETPKAPKEISQVVKKTPYWFGKMVGKWESQNLGVTCLVERLAEALSLKDHAKEAFCAGLIRSADLKWKHADPRQLMQWGDGDQILERVVCQGRWSNRTIETLASRLASKSNHYVADVTPFAKGSKSPLLGLSKDMIHYICGFLSPVEAAKLTLVCKQLFHWIGRSNGGPIWVNKKLGSIGAAGLIHKLSPYITNPSTARKPQGRNHVPIGALLIAWPRDQLPTLAEQTKISDLNLSISTFLGRIFVKQGPMNVALTNFNAEDPLDQSFALLTLRSYGRDRPMLTRFLREHPAYFKRLDWSKPLPVRMGSVWSHLGRYGLPRNGLHFFCQAVKKAWALGRQELVREQMVPILKRIQKDHPDFEFKGKIPEGLL